MNKIKAIWRLLFPPKVERKSKLKIVHTFQNGRTLWTYEDNDFLNISSRYYSAIMTEMVHLEILHQTKHQWKTAVKYGNETCLDIIEQSDDRRTVIDKATQLKQLFNNFDLSIQGIQSSSQTLIEMMFCMFFLLDDESEFGYNEAKNKEKLDLINSEPYAKELFFCQVEKILSGYFPISDTTLAEYIVQIQQTKIFQGIINSPNTSKK